MTDKTIWVVSTILVASISFWFGAILQDYFTTYSIGSSGGIESCMCPVYQYHPEISPLFGVIVVMAIAGIGWFVRGWLEES